MRIYIDKSRFDSDEERAQYEALVKKASIDLDDPANANFELPPAQNTNTKQEDTNMEKSATSPELTAALERMEALEKSIAMKEFTDIAKKYAALGEKEDELAQRFYDMKKSNEANYNAYIAILDKSLGLVEKSGIFAEIGKSGSNGPTAGDAVSKIEAAATELQKSDPTLTRVDAIAKSWENHPELIAEYEAEFNK